ncbi:hypothetical protein CHS0354_030078 [Potamilus streckersoni]|uniref:Uncharacterized protein n=1 Tax=Potamilus streckersoni TaxID=2493646 RepID=A0AAE0VEU5_9BIVA|nr:hypothetical protein CHS0354_030078 [Potamilus streckersoni]
MCILYLWTSPGEEIYAQTPESPVKPNNASVNQPEPTPSAEENQKINQKPPEPEGDANCKNPACYPFMFGSIPATGVLGIKYIHLYIPFTGYGADTYNSYLERQFGHKGAVLYGIQLMLGIKLLKPMETIDRAEINLELFEGSTKLKYNDLNGLEKQNDLTVSYQQILLNVFHQMNRYLGAAESGNAVTPFQHYIQLGGGIGYNTCGRDYPVPGSSQDNPSGTANDIFPFSQGNWAASWKNTRTINVLLPASPIAGFQTQVENAIQRWNSLLVNQGITLNTITSGRSDIKIKWSDGSDMASGVIGFAKFSPSETDNRILALSTQDNRNGRQHTSKKYTP